MHACPLTILLVDQAILFVVTCTALLFAYRAQKNARWLQEVLTPLVSHIIQVVDPNYPKPPDPPPVEG